MEIEALLTRLVRASDEYRAAQEAVQRDGAAVIREARKQLGLTQRDLAEKLHVSFTYISKIENGHVRIGQDTLMALVELVRSSVRSDAPEAAENVPKARRSAKK